MTLLDELRALAFASAHARDANHAIGEVRGDDRVSYEVLVPGTGADAHLLDKVLPKLVYFLDCRGAKLGPTPQLFVSLFVHDQLSFIEAGPFASALAKRKGLDEAEALRRYGAGGAGDPLLLGAAV